MRNLWLVARHEYRHTVVRRGFVLLTAALPLGLVALIALAILVEGLGANNLPLGYVDHAGVLDASLHDADQGMEIRAFPDEETALAALGSEEIQALFVLPPGYPQTLHTELYYLEEPPSEDVWGEFDDFVRVNLVAALPQDVQHRLLEGPSITVHDVASKREFSESSMFNIILPFVATFFFFFATMSAGGYMLSVVATEKENRTMEVMVTSISPTQLIGGKTVGLLAASLTQLSIYAIAIVVGVSIAAQYLPELQHITVPWDYLGLMALFFLPAYTLIAAVMVAIGAAVTEVQQGQQVAGLLNMLFVLPLLLMPLIIQNPGHPLAVLLTLFPTTSFLTVSLRWGLGTVPLWQLGVSWVLLVASTVLMVWAAARIFRAGMLRYGQPLDFRAALQAIRG
jgi:ABC-2 type transport system permease protein